MLINSKSKEYLTKLLDDPNMEKEIDSENWDKVYKYFLHMFSGSPMSVEEKFEIYSDLTRFLLESGINPLVGQDHISGFTFYGEYDLEELPVIPSSVKKINSKAYTEVVTHEPMELTIPGTVETVDLLKNAKIGTSEFNFKDKQRRFSLHLWCFFCYI